jgi:tRNA G18 (ribose-2'-O)-methylase SpoU
MKKVVVLENLRSLHNVGSIFRTADGAGFDKVYLTGYTGTPPDRRIEKVSLGAEEFLKWEKNENPIDCVRQLKIDGFTILALEQTSTSQNIFEFKLDKIKKIALIMGNEVEGVSKELLSLSDYTLEIPMYGQKGSLNVSIAAGIAMYQV